MIQLHSSDFELFGLPLTFQQNSDAIEARWRELQAQVHPDRYVSEGAAAQRVAMQWAVRVNEAYRRLKDPLQRAALLCELHEVPVDAQNNTTMPTSFLMQQMQWRERLDEAQNASALEALESEISLERQTALSALQTTLDEQHDYAAASQQLQALMFIERLVQNIEERMADELEQAR